MKRLFKSITVVGLAWVMACGFMPEVRAEIPRLINYQGKLTDQAGAPLDGAYELTFRIYDDVTAGNLLWQESHSGVVITQGIFSVMLGSQESLGLAFDIPYYLEIKVGDEVMTPRQQITSVGYAIHAATADSAQTVTSAVNADKLSNKTYDSTELKPFGSWTLMAKETVYQAQTDGLVIARNSDSGSGGVLVGYTDSNNPPTTRRIHADSSAGYLNSSIILPVRKGDYWKIHMIGGNGVATVYWLPMGN